MTLSPVNLAVDYRFLLAAGGLTVVGVWFLKQGLGASLDGILADDNSVNSAFENAYEQVTGSGSGPAEDVFAATHDPDTGRPIYDWYDPRYYAVRSLDRLTGADAVYR